MTGLTAYVGLTRIAADQARRRRLRVGRGRRRGQRGRPDRQGARREPGHRQRRLGREGAPRRRGPRVRRGVQLQGRPGLASSCARRRPTASTCTSTTSAVSTSRPRSGSLRLGGRIAVCGMISVYNDTEPAPGPRNLSRLIQTRGRIEGFLVGDHYDLAREYAGLAAQWLGDGRLQSRETFATASTGRSTPSSACCVARTPGRWSSASDVRRAKAHWRLCARHSAPSRPTKSPTIQRPERNRRDFPP